MPNRCWKGFQSVCKEASAMEAAEKFLDRTEERADLNQWLESLEISCKQCLADSKQVLVLFKDSVYLRLRDPGD